MTLEQSALIYGGGVMLALWLAVWIGSRGK